MLAELTSVSSVFCYFCHKDKLETFSVLFIIDNYQEER